MNNNTNIDEVGGNNSKKIFRIIPILGGATTICFTLYEYLLKHIKLATFGLERIDLDYLTLIANMVICIAFIIIWVAKKNRDKGIKFFTIPWLAFWSGLTLYYIAMIYFYDPTTKEASVEETLILLLLNNANTIFLFLAYLSLVHPKGLDLSGNNKPFIYSFLGTVVIFILITVFTIKFPKEGEVLSGFFAFMAFCFLGSRLESLFPQKYEITTIIFLYAAVQLFWIGNVDNVLLVYSLAFVGKVFLGYIITWNYQTITERSLRYFEVKSQGLPTQE